MKTMAFRNICQANFSREKSEFRLRFQTLTLAGGASTSQNVYYSVIGETSCEPRL